MLNGIKTHRRVKKIRMLMVDTSSVFVWMTLVCQMHTRVRITLPNLMLS